MQNNQILFKYNKSKDVIIYNLMLNNLMFFNLIELDLIDDIFKLNELNQVENIFNRVYENIIFNHQIDDSLIKNKIKLKIKKEFNLFIFNNENMIKYKEKILDLKFKEELKKEIEITTNTKKRKI